MLILYRNCLSYCHFNQNWNGHENSFNGSGVLLTYEQKYAEDGGHTFAKFLSQRHKSDELQGITQHATSDSNKMLQNLL
jgi:hypothetical protein